MESAVKLILKWNGKEYDLELNENDTVLDLKSEIEKQTGVKTARQKLLNLKVKGKSSNFININISFHFITCVL